MIAFMVFIYFCVVSSIFASPVQYHDSVEDYYIVERAGMDEKLPDVFPDYSDLVFEEINFKTKEVQMSNDDWYIAVQKCLMKCMQDHPEDYKKPFYKNYCIQKTCDFY